MDPLADPRWDAYVDAHPEGILYQHSAWLRALRREYPRSEQLGMAAVGDGGAFVGVLPLQWTAGLPVGPRGVVGRRLASLPRTPVCGPLADDEATATALVRAAAEAAVAGGAPSLQVKLHATPVDVAGVPGAAVHPWREAYVLDLPADEGDVRFGNSRNHSRIRWAVNKSRKAGVRVREAAADRDVRAWYPLYLEALRFNAVPPRPLRLFLGLWEELAPRGLMTLLLAEDERGTLIGGAVILELGATAFYAFNGVRRSALALRPNEVVQWEAIHRAVRAGRRRYDLGEVVERHEGLADFKRKWGADARRLERLYCPAPDHAPDPGDADAGRVRELAERAYRRAPLRLTAAIGDGLYRYL